MYCLNSDGGTWCSKVKVKVSGFCLIQRTLNTHLLPVLLKRVQLNEKSLLFVYQCATLSQESKSVVMKHLQWHFDMTKGQGTDKICLLLI